MTLPAVVGDHMVLQQRAVVVLWGWTDRRQEVVVTPSWSDSVYRAQPDAAGAWKVHVRTPDAGGPYTITFSDGIPLTLKDVLVGEVWLASGQSNMEFDLSRSAEAAEAVREASDPAIRFFKVARQIGKVPLSDTPGSTWLPASPDTAGTFSAVAYHFARTLHRRTGMPVGIIEASWGGTPAEAWTPRPVLAADPWLQVALDRWEAWKRDSALIAESEAKELALYMTRRPHREPGVMFNGMIHPVVPFTLKGFLWYQGESNVRWADEYEHLLSTLIRSWRAAWETEATKGTELPFLLVEIAPFRYSDMEAAAVLREAQKRVADMVERTGVATTIDLGDMEDIHPTRKREVGERLARLALVTVYGAEVGEHAGPALRRAVVEGDRVRVHFAHADGGLIAPGGRLSGFEISGRDEPSRFWKATARIDGDAVLVWNDEVSEPAAVRYGWGEQIANYSLFNRVGLPAGPFRTELSRAADREKNVGAAAPRWYRGNTHVHTNNSDGNRSPAEVARWYIEYGYDFLVITDHEHVTDPELINARYAGTGRILIVRGQEITQQVAGSTHPGARRQAHVNGIGVSRVVRPLGEGCIVRGVSVARVNAHAIAGIRAAGGIAQVNHPNFRWSLQPDDLATLPDSTLLEVWNAQPRINNFGGSGGAGRVSLSTEALCDTLLTRRTLVWGVASDDARNFRPGAFADPEATRPGGGWVMVGEDTLTPGAIIAALHTGRFYSSTGITLWRSIRPPSPRSA